MHTHSLSPTHTCNLQGLYCVGDSTFPGQGVNAVAMSGIGCAHRVGASLPSERGRQVPADCAPIARAAPPCASPPPLASTNPPSLPHPLTKGTGKFT